MSIFCKKVDVSVVNVNNLLYNLIGTKKTGSNSIITSQFADVFKSDITNISISAALLNGACGLTNDAPIYISNGDSVSFNGNKNYYIDYDIYYSFWSDKQKVSDFSLKVFDSTLNEPISEESVIPYLKLIVLLVDNLFNYFFCVSNGGVLPDLSPDNIHNGIVENWRLFLVYTRGLGTINSCNYCIEDYFIPMIKDEDSGIAGKIIRNAMYGDDILKKWCGCCLPQSNPYKYNNVEYNFENPFSTNKLNLPLECDSICSSTDSGVHDFNNDSNSIPLTNGYSSVVNSPLDLNENDIDYSATTCRSNICVISNIDIKAISYQGKGITFNQVCPGCTKGDCICYSYGKGVFDKIKAGNDSMQDPVTFNQYCPNSFCYQEQTDGKYEEVKCNTVSPANTGKETDNNYLGEGIFSNLSDADIYGVNIWLFPILLTFIFILFFIGAIYVTIYRNRLITRERHTY